MAWTQQKVRRRKSTKVSQQGVVVSDERKPVGPDLMQVPAHLTAPAGLLDFNSISAMPDSNSHDLLSCKACLLAGLDKTCDQEPDEELLLH